MDILMAKTHLLMQSSSAPASTRGYSMACPGKTPGIEGHPCPGSPHTTRQCQPRSSPASPTRQAALPWSYLGEEECKISRKETHSMRFVMGRQSHRILLFRALSLDRSRRETERTRNGAMRPRSRSISSNFPVCLRKCVYKNVGP